MDYVRASLLPFYIHALTGYSCSCLWSNGRRRWLDIREIVTLLVDINVVVLIVVMLVLGARIGDDYACASMNRFIEADSAQTASPPNGAVWVLGKYAHI